MPSLTTMICVTLIIVEMIVSVKGADPSAFQSKAGLADDVKAAADGDFSVKFPIGDGITFSILTFLRELLT